MTSLSMCLRRGSVEWAHNLLNLVMFDSLKLQFSIPEKINNIVTTQIYPGKPSWGRKPNKLLFIFNRYNEEPLQEGQENKVSLSNPSAKDNTKNPNARNDKP